MEVTGVGDKCQITDTVAGTLSGHLPFKVGKTETGVDPGFLIGGARRVKFLPSIDLGFLV